MSYDAPDDGVPVYPVQDTQDMNLDTPPGLVVRRYHPDCPAWGEVRWAPIALPAGERLLYVREPAALPAVLDVLRAAPVDWSVPSAGPSTDTAIRGAVARAATVEGVRCA